MSNRETRSNSKTGAGIPKRQGSEAAVASSSCSDNYYPELLQTTFLKIERKSTEELNMIKFKEFILQQPNWGDKIQDEKAVAKWIKEFGLLKTRSTTNKFVTNVVNNLKHCLSNKQKDVSIELGAGDRSWLSDKLINSAIRNKLLINVEILEASINKNQIDFNDANEQVCDLLSPSMYPLVAKRSKILKRFPNIENFQGRESLIRYQSEDDFLSTEDAEVVFKIYEPVPSEIYSERYQWLPSEFKIGEDNFVRIISYINNLYPDTHSVLYSVIAEIFQKLIPLFEIVWTDMHQESVRIRQKLGLELPKKIEELKLAGKTIQVIPKLTNILLTPNKPNYPGDRFQKSGMLNENIMATAIYFYDHKNITDPRLEFQEEVMNLKYVHNQTKERIPFTQGLGSVLTKQGRCIGFPNTNHHRLTPFRLLDATQSGWIKTLTFFLVDPMGSKVLSTYHVPPQQKSWFVDEILKGPICFPKEVLEIIVENLDWPMGFKEARKHRDKIREERKSLPVLQDNREYYLEQTSSFKFH